MMALPFALISGGLIALLCGRRGLMLGFWGAALAWLLLLFYLHASDPLPLQF
ncbi:DUF5993 family protein [Aquibaculum sediminis]|uniref:DUF5993 family protein n=1 Tax=Aquibaculum sediminis TaxID=3231907 RepID=UPI003456DA3F